MSPGSGSGSRDPHSDQFPILLSFEVPPALSNIAHLRKTCCCFLDSLGVSQDALDDIETLIGELTTNAVRHAGEDSGSYQLQLELTPDLVAVTVIDNGIGFSPETVLPPGTMRSDTLETEGDVRFGGLGLPLIYAIADRVEVQPTLPHGTSVRAEKELR